MHGVFFLTLHTGLCCRRLPSPGPSPLWKSSTAGIHCGKQKQPGTMDIVGLLKSQFLCHLVFCYVFIASGLIINTVQLFTLLLWPVNKQLFRKINCRLSYCISSRKRLAPTSLFVSALLASVRIRPL